MFGEDRIFMPVPQRMGRGDRMGRGPYEKSGLLQDNSLPPLRTVTTDWDIFFPVEEQDVDDETVRTYPVTSLDVNVKLWYLPFGGKDDDPFLWRDETRTVSFDPTGL